MGNAKYLLLFLFFMPGVIGFHTEQLFYFENLTYEDTFNTNTSSYIWMNETAPVGPESIITFYNPEILHTDTGTDLLDYSASGTGNVSTLEDIRCLHGSACILLQGITGGPTETPTITHDLVDVDLTQAVNPLFDFSLVDIDLEPSEEMEIFFFDGAVYNLVFVYNGSNNANTLAGFVVSDWVNFTIPIPQIYRHASFRWFVRGTMNGNSAEDAIIFEGPIIRETANTSFQIPMFYHIPESQARIDVFEVNVYLSSDTNVSYTSRTSIIDGFLIEEDVLSSVDGAQNFTYISEQPFLLIESNDDLTYTIFGELGLNDNITFRYGGATAPSHIGVIESLSEVNFTDYSFNNITFPPVINMSLESINPVISLRLERDAVNLGFMSFCTPDVYCLSDATFPLSALQVNYTFYAEDNIGLNHTFTAQQNNTVPDRILVTPNFNGEFYVPLNQSTLFSLSVIDSQSFIVSDAEMRLFFPSLSQYFNLSYNPSTQVYDTNLIFDTEGEYPFEVESVKVEYQLEENITGLVMVREETQVCFEVYTDTNTSQPYENNLAQVLVFKHDDIKENNILFKEQLSLWTDGGVGYFDVNALHAPYQDGQACMSAFEINEDYDIYLLQGIMSFKDNYDPPNIHEITGVSSFLGVITLQQDTTYKVYLPRAELAYGKITTNLKTFIIFSIFIGVSVGIAIVSSSIAAFFLSFFGFLIMWGFVEIFIWVFT